MVTGWLRSFRVRSPDVFRLEQRRSKELTREGGSIVAFASVVSSPACDTEV
jgi:hypothetical protein